MRNPIGEVLQERCADLGGKLLGAKLWVSAFGEVTGKVAWTRDNGPWPDLPGVTHSVTLFTQGDELKADFYGGRYDITEEQALESLHA